MVRIRLYDDANLDAEFHLCRKRSRGFCLKAGVLAMAVVPTWSPRHPSSALMMSPAWSFYCGFSLEG